MEKLTQSERESIQEGINELQSRLDEQVEEVVPKPKPEVGQVYEYSQGTCLLVDGDRNIYLDHCAGSFGTWDHGGVAEHTELLGTFDEVYVRRDTIREELKEKFMKMEDRYSDPGGGCNTFSMYSTQKQSFIDNLFDGKNCDGTLV